MSVWCVQSQSTPQYHSLVIPLMITTGDIHSHCCELLSSDEKIRTGILRDDTKVTGKHSAVSSNIWHASQTEPGGPGLPSSYLGDADRGIMSSRTFLIQKSKEEKDHRRKPSASCLLSVYAWGLPFKHHHHRWTNNPPARESIRLRDMFTNVSEYFERDLRWCNHLHHTSSMQSRVCWPRSVILALQRLTATKLRKRASEMARQVKVFITNPEFEPGT